MFDEYRGGDTLGVGDGGNESLIILKEYIQRRVQVLYSYQGHISVLGYWVEIFSLEAYHN